MSWLIWSNPVADWWLSLIAVSALNIVLLLGLLARWRKHAAGRPGDGMAALLVALGAVYVLGCAFRSVLPRADVARLCLFDTPLSSILVGRSVATLAELCFAAQWAIVLHELGRLAESDTAKTISKLVVPLIATAECCSWYAVITTDYLGNVLENSLWMIAFFLVAAALVRLVPRFRGTVQSAIAATAGGAALYVAFMVAINVPMYVFRWEAQTASGHVLLGFAAGLHDLASRWIVSRDIARWRHDMLWMSLYFSVAVWMSLALGGFGLIRRHLPRHLAPPRKLKPARRPLPAAVSHP